MMKKFTLVLALGAVLFIQSCKNEEPVVEPDIIVGTWINDALYFRDLPVSHAGWEGSQLTIENISPYTSYTIVFKEDTTFLRTFVQSGPDDIDEGTYSKTNTELVLSSSDFDFDEEYDIESLDEVEMTISELSAFLLPSDISFDSLDNGLITEFEDHHFVAVDLRLEYYFERQVSN